jgi:glycerophosphoryl diester phosphodiesterase
MNWGLALRSWADLRFQLRTVLAFQLLVQLASFALISPLLTWLARQLVRLSGEPVISNFAIGAFLLTPAGAGFVLLLFLLVCAALFVQLAGQSWIAGAALAHRTPTVQDTVKAVLRRAPALTRLSARIVLRLLLLAAPFAAAAVLCAALLPGGHDINYYLAERPPEWRRAVRVGAVLAAGYGGLVLWQLGRWILAIPILMHEGVAPREALVASVRRTRGRLLTIVGSLLAWWLALLACGRLVARLGGHLESMALGASGADPVRILPLVTVFVIAGIAGTFLLNSVLIAGQQFLVTRFYLEQLGARTPLGPPIAATNPTRFGRWGLVATGLALLLCGAGLMWWVAARGTSPGAVAVTAHRGYHASAPENSLAAFRAAIAARADFSELDVQRTRDGVVVVLHDADLMRMADDPRRVRELTLAELADIDIGRKSGAAYAGERVPTLAAVIALVRGHMKLNVELKYNGADSQLAAAVLDVLRREHFLDQVIITSLSAAALAQVRELEPSLPTGQIVTVAVGNVTRSPSDFLSLNAARATPELIRRAHAAGKAVHVWTVNQAEPMLRLIERGVDNLITDEPALARRVLEQRGSLSGAEELALRLRVLFSQPPRELLDPQAVPAL